MTIKWIKALIEEIGESIEEHNRERNSLMMNFFSILFWKNYGEGYVYPKLIDEIFVSIEEAQNQSVPLHLNNILPLINKIRKNIRLPELTTEYDGFTLMELTSEIKKDIMLKKLKDEKKF